MVYKKGFIFINGFDKKKSIPIFFFPDILKAYEKLSSEGIYLILTK